MREMSPRAKFIPQTDSRKPGRSNAAIHPWANRNKDSGVNTGVDTEYSVSTRTGRGIDRLRNRIDAIRSETFSTNQSVPGSRPLPVWLTSITPAPLSRAKARRPFRSIDRVHACALNVHVL